MARLLTRRLGREVSRTTINEWVTTAGAGAKTPLQVSQELAPPNWGGWIGVDGKHLRIGARSKAVLMIAVDQASADIVNSKVVAVESGDVFAQLITEAVTQGAYPLRGVVADLGSGAPHWGFPEASRRYFANLPFQACRVHLARRLDMFLSTPRTHPSASANTELRARIRSILFADTYQDAVKRYWQLAANEHRYTTKAARSLIWSLRRTFEIHMTHHRNPGLPADANITEGVIRQLNRKLKPMEHLATLESAEHFSRLLIAAYRWRAFTDSTNQRNGNSPLQLAGATLPTKHWLTYLQQTHTI